MFIIIIKTIALTSSLVGYNTFLSIDQLLSEMNFLKSLKK